MWYCTQPIVLYPVFLRRCISKELCNQPCWFVSQKWFVRDAQWAYRNRRFRMTMRIMYHSLFNESISLHIFVSFARLNNSAWMSGLRPSSTAKQKESLSTNDCHSVPSIGQRRRFAGDKSGVTFWKYFADDDGLCLYVRGLFGQHMWLLAARPVYYLFCLFFLSFTDRNDNERLLNLGLGDWQLTLTMRGRDVEEAPSVTSSQSSTSFLHLEVFFLVSGQKK